MTITRLGLLGLPSADYADFAKRSHFIDKTGKNKINVEWWLKPNTFATRQWILPERSTSWILRKRTEQ